MKHDFLEFLQLISGLIGKKKKSNFYKKLLWSLVLYTDV